MDYLQALTHKLLKELFIFCMQCKGVYRKKSRGGGANFQNLNRKFKTFGFLDTLNVHIQSNYLTSTTISLLQTKIAEKNIKKTKQNKTKQ